MRDELREAVWIVAILNLIVWAAALGLGTAALVVGHWAWQPLAH